jgi:hypothetical protein
MNVLQLGIVGAHLHDADGLDRRVLFQMFHTVLLQNRLFLKYLQNLLRFL